MEYAIVTIATAVMTLVFGAIEYKVRQMEKLLSTIVPRDEVKEMISDKVQVQEVLITELKSDIHRMEAKLDRLIEREAGEH